MIKHLYIKNIVLIDELSLDFENGFSAFTGETGAGKSILIDAISLLGRERASAAQIRHGETRAIVEGTFDLSHDSHALAVLGEAGFEVDPEEVTFTRELSASGKNTARIDHRIVTIGLLNDVLQNQIDIHNQRDNQYLLNARTHIDLLDEYLGCGDLRQKTAEAYAVWQAAVREKEKTL
ncbi:MAG: AAA family ATPase, partial [Solobacterium sp.]|nr:AAA family ATPase [Solobacterium sp.]